MRKKFKIVLLLAALGCLIMGNLNIFAANGSFKEVPPNKVEIVPYNNESVVLLSDPSLLSCGVGIGIADNGLLMEFDTNASQNADEIGVRNIVLQEKTWFGTWNNISVGSYCSYNSDYYAGEIVYTAAKKGTTYRIKCTHYAKYGSNELSMNNTSSELTYN